MSRATQPQLARGEVLPVGGNLTRLLVACGAFFALVVTGLLAVSSASAAITLSAAANGTEVGTPTTPQPVIATLNTTIDNNGAAPTPIPVGQTASLTQTFPSEFANQLASFGACPESSYDDEKTAPGGAEDPTVSCPANSLVGNGSLKLVAQAGPTTIVASSERVVIVKDATTGGLAFWVSYTVLGNRISKIIRGSVGSAGAGQTTIAWDTTPVQPPAPPVKMLEFNTAYNANKATLQTPEPFASTGCSSGSWAFSVANSFVGGSPAGQTATASVPCTAPSAPAPGTATIGSKPVKVTARGKGAFKLSCSTVGSCTGSFEIRPKGKKSGPRKPKKAPLASGSYTLAAGASSSVKFALNNRGRTLLERTGTLRVTVRLKPTLGPSTTKVVTLKAG